MPILHQMTTITSENLAKGVFKISTMVIILRMELVVELEAEAEAEAEAMKVKSSHLKDRKSIRLRPSIVCKTNPNHTVQIRTETPKSSTLLANTMPVTVFDR